MLSRKDNFPVLVVVASLFTHHHQRTLEQVLRACHSFALFYIDISSVLAQPGVDHD